MSLPRYPEYKDSEVEWLQEVPAHWSIAPMKRLLDIQNGADYKNIEADNGYPVLGSGGPFAFATDYIYDGESVLLGRKGTIDRPLHVTGKFWTVDTMYWSRIRPTACGRFCYYAATTIPFGLYSTNTALPSMTKGALDAHLIVQPPFDEQRAISEFLDRETAKIDALIAEQEKLLALLAEKRQATISHAVTRGLDPNAPMKDSGIPWLGEVPVHWEVLSLKNVVVLQRGHDLPADSRQEGGVPVVSSAGYIGFHNEARASGPGIVTGRYGSIGSFVYVEADYWPLNTALYSVALHGNDAKYVWYVLQSVAEHFVLNSMKSAVPGVDRNDLHKVAIVRAPNLEQKAIVIELDAVLESLDGLSGQCESAIELLKERRSALTAAAVTGKIDVRGLVEPQGA